MNLFHFSISSDILVESFVSCKSNPLSCGPCMLFQNYDLMHANFESNSGLFKLHHLFVEDTLFLTFLTEVFILIPKGKRSLHTIIKPLAKFLKERERERTATEHTNDNAMHATCVVCDQIPS